MRLRATDRINELAISVADEVGRQVKTAGLPLLLARSVTRQVAASGLDPGSSTSNPLGVLVLLSYEAGGGDLPQVALPVAAAFQFLLSAADVLDDLQDGDQVAGLTEQDPVAGAELMAALLELCHLGFIDAIRYGCKPERAAVASAALSRFALVALGAQHREIHASARSVGGVEGARATVRAKSGSFGRAACEAGAALATDDQRLVTRIGDFGEHWAVVDQLLDDIDAVWPGGKPDRNLMNRRHTLPIVLTREAIPAFGSESTELEARNAVFRSGAIHKTWVIAAVTHARASRIAMEINATNPRSTLHELLRN